MSYAFESVNFNSVNEDQSSFRKLSGPSLQTSVSMKKNNVYDFLEDWL